MRRQQTNSIGVLLVLLAMVATACSSPASAEPALVDSPTIAPVSAQPVVADSPTLAPTVAPAQTTFTDPFAYCAAVGTLDRPDARYTGEAVPQAIVEGYKKAAGLEDSTEPMAMFQKGTVWRCLDGQVEACNVGANLPCSEKANTDKTPTPEMNDFCKANPTSDFIPMVVTGHNSIYSWDCVQGVPQVLDQIDQVDAAGFLTSIWYPLSVDASASSAATSAASSAAIQPLSMEVCDGQAQAMAHYLDVLEVTQSEVPLNDLVTGKSGTGCQAMVTGTGAKFAGPNGTLKLLAAMMADEGWTEDIKLQAGGPTGIGTGYRKGNQLCLVGVIWLPDASANCPKDQPISACNVKPEQQNYTITLVYGVEQ